MANAGTVNVNLVANSSEFIDGMEKANRMLAKFGWQSSETVKDIGKIKQSIEGFVTIVKGFAGFGIAMSVFDSFKRMREEVAQFANGGLEVYNAMNKQASAIGASIDVMSTFRSMATSAGVESEKFTTALVNMQKSIERASELGSEADRAFRSLGINFTDFIGMPIEERYKKISDAIANTNNKTVAVTASAEIFKEVSKDIAVILNQGSAAYDKSAETLAKYGAKIDELTKTKLKVLSDRLAKMQEEIDLYQILAQAANAENKIQEKAAELADAKSKADKAAKAGRDQYLSDIFNITDAQGRENRERTEQLRSYSAEVQRSVDAQKKAAADTASAQVSSSATANAAKESEIVTTMKAVAAEKRRNDVASVNKKMLDEMYNARVRQEDQEARAAKKASDSYRGALEVVNKFYSDVAAARKKNDEEYRTKSAADDPRVKEAIARRALGGGRMDPAIQGELLRIEQERIAIEQKLGDPSQDPKVLYQRKVELLLKEEGIRSAEDERKRIEMEKMEKSALYSDFFGNLSTIAGAFAEQSKEMFLISKVASIAQAEINAWMAYSNILAKESILGLAPAQIMAGVALAAGQVAVMNIAKQTPPGRAMGGAVTRNSIYEVAERGPEILESKGKTYLLSGDSSGRVQPMGPGGGARVSVTVNNLPGQTARVTEGGTPSNPTVNIDIVDAMVAASIANGRSQTSRAMSSRFGLNSARGAS